MYKIAFLKHNKVVAVIRSNVNPKTTAQLYNIVTEAIPVNKYGDYVSVEAHKTYRYCQFIIMLLDIDQIDVSAIPESYYQYIQIVPIDSHILEVSDVNPNELYYESDGQTNCLVCHEVHSFCTPLQLKHF